MIKFMKFFKEKREHTLAAVDGDFDDTVEDRLRSMDPPYSFEDVQSALDHLQIMIKDGVRQDLTKMLGMNVLLIKNLLETANEAGVCGAMFAGFLFDCADDLLDQEVAGAIVDHATTAALEEALLCREDDAFAGLEERYPAVSELLVE